MAAVVNFSGVAAAPARARVASRGGLKGRTGAKVRFLRGSSISEPGAREFTPRETRRGGAGPLVRESVGLCLTAMVGRRKTRSCALSEGTWRSLALFPDTLNGLRGM